MFEAGAGPNLANALSAVKSSGEGLVHCCGEFSISKKRGEQRARSKGRRAKASSKRAKSEGQESWCPNRIYMIRVWKSIDSGIRTALRLKSKRAKSFCFALGPLLLALCSWAFALSPLLLAAFQFP